MPGLNHLDLHFLRRAPRPRRNHRVQTTAAHHCHAPDFGHRLDRDRVSHPSGAIEGPVDRSKQDARTRGRHAHFDNQADVDTSDCSLRHRARKSEVVGASQLAVKFHESLTASIRAASLPPPILVVADRRGVNDANAFVIRLLPIGVIEETCAITKEYGRDVDFHFVDQAGLRNIAGRTYSHHRPTSRSLPACSLCPGGTKIQFLPSLGGHGSSSSLGWISKMSQQVISDCPLHQ